MSGNDLNNNQCSSEPLSHIIEIPKKSKGQRRRERKAARKFALIGTLQFGLTTNNYATHRRYDKAKYKWNREQEGRIQNRDVMNQTASSPLNQQHTTTAKIRTPNKVTNGPLSVATETVTQSMPNSNKSQCIKQVTSTTRPQNSVTLPIATESTVTKITSNSNENESTLSRTTPEQLTEQILLQLSNLDKQNLKSIINNSDAKFESALQAQSRKRIRAELRKKLRNFNLHQDQTVNNVSLRSMIDSGRIPSDVLKKIEEIFKLDLFQNNESHEEIPEVVEESEGEDDIATGSNDVLSDTYMLLVKYGLIPELSQPEITESVDEINKTSNDLSETNIINVDELPSVPRVYEDTITNITNDDVILIEPRNEIITIGSPEHEFPSDEMENLKICQLPSDSMLECETNDYFSTNDSQDEIDDRIQGDNTPGFSNMASLIENTPNDMSSSILMIIKEYNAKLQKCYTDKKEIDSAIATLQSQRDSLENTIAQIQATQTQFLELFLQKSNVSITETPDTIQASSSEIQPRKRKLSTTSISSQEPDKQPRIEISETNGKSTHSTATNIPKTDKTDQGQITNTDSQLTKRNSQEQTRNHLCEVKDIVKTNDYLVVSAGAEIFRYSSSNLELEKVYKRHRALVTGVYVLNNEYVFSVSLDMNLHKFSLEGFQNPLSANFFNESLTALEYGWNNLFIGSSRGRIISFGIDTNKISLDFHSDVKHSISTLKSVEISNKKYLTVLTTKSLCFYICDPQTGSIIKTIETFNYINDISIDNDSIYCGLNSNELLTFSIFSGRSHDPKELDTKSIIKCVKTYKNLVLIGCSDGYIHVYHKSTNLYLDIVRVTDKGLIAFEVYPRKIVFCAADKTITVSDMPQEITIYLE